jgi:ubiquinone/menaquinone biosynthesis C-methylase UbiE
MVTMNPKDAAHVADDYVVDEWEDQHLATVFSKWHSFLARSEVESVDAIIAAAEIQPGDSVIDIACGSGIPALNIATIVGPGGHVTATDPSPVFLNAIESNARALGLTNLTFERSTAAGLLYPDQHFDAATCHYGAMFFPDLIAGLASIRRVLKPGRRAAFVAWGPPQDNELFGTFLRAAGPYLPPTSEAPMAAAEPDEHTPNPNRFAKQGTLSARLKKAGFSDIREESRFVEFIWPGIPESLRDFWLELTGMEEKIAPERRASFRDDIAAAFRRFTVGYTVELTAKIVIASGRA